MSAFYVIPSCLSFQTAVGLLASIAIISIAIYGLYNAFLHPLSKYPGPKLWTAYRLPFVIRSVQGVLPFKVLEFHRQYGPVVRIAPDELVFSDAEAWDDLMRLLPDRRQNTKDPSTYGPEEPGTKKSILLASDAIHARLRRIYGRAFTPNAVEEQADMILRYANLLVSGLKQSLEKDAVLNLSDWYNFATFDLTGEFAFGEAFKCLEQGGAYHFFVKSVLVGAVIGNKLGMIDRYGIWSLLRPLLPRSFFQAKVDMDNYNAALIEKRAERGYVPSRTDAFNYLLQNKNEEDRLNRDELIENGLILVVAGSETTASLMTAVTWLLCTNPDKYQKVRYEVRSTFRSDEEMNTKTVNDLPYMIAVLSETLRLVPPAPYGFPRRIVSRGGQSVAGYHVPEKTYCAVFHYAAYRYDRNFARPDSFIPERWLPNAPPEFKDDAYNVLQPFHTGPRGCLGQNLAYAEMRLLLAKMLWHFDMELAHSQDNWFAKLQGFTIWNRSGLDIRLKSVKR